MKRFISERSPAFWLTVFLCLFISISLWVITPSKPKDYLDYVSDSPSPTGVKAFYTYLERENDTVGRWRQAPNQLPKENQSQLLLMIEPSFIPDEKIMEEYEDFMEAGNTILLLKTNPDEMFDIQANDSAFANDSRDVEDTDGDTYKAVKSSSVRIEPGNDDDVLLTDSSGAIAVERDYQNGKLVTAVIPDWVTNDQITEEDHIDLLVSMIDDDIPDWDAIYMDEYIHEAGNATPLTRIYPSWLLMAGFQFILLLILWMWYKGKRFGSIAVPREGIVRFSDERTKALAAWYTRANLYYDSFRIQADYCRHLLQERWGVPYYKNWVDIAPQLERKNLDVSKLDVSDLDIQSFLKGIAYILRHGRMNKKEYLYWSKRLDRLRREVEDE